MISSLDAAGVKRWIVKYFFHRYSVSSVGPRFMPSTDRGQEVSMGPDLLAYIIYQIIELRLPQE